MNRAEQSPEAPTGSLFVSDKTQRRWSWIDAAPPLTELVRCAKEQWYLLRARDVGDHPRTAPLIIRFFAANEPLEQLAVAPSPVGSDGLAWFQTPDTATHFQLELPPRENGTVTERLDVFPISERDPKCHPLANVPVWSSLQPPFPIRRVIVPELLAECAELVPEIHFDVSPPEEPFATLRDRARGNAVIISSDWARLRKLDFARLCELAESAWVIVDLGTFAEIVAHDGVDIPVKNLASDNGLMSGRVSYSDTLTRGFALLDAFPYGRFDERGRFSTRSIPKSRKWNKFATENDFAEIITSETPRAKDSSDILVAAMPTAGGELIVSDVPWLAALPERYQIAPQLTRHLLRTHLGAPIPDHVQYWNRWDETPIVLRDIGELPKRYPVLTTVRWEPTDDQSANLGVALRTSGTDGRNVVFETGRIDRLVPHDGMPPEPMTIAMKFLAREVRNQTDWAAKFLAGVNVVWRFTCVGSSKYSTHFHAAPPTLTTGSTTTLRLRSAQTADADQTFPPPAGLFGDSSLQYMDELMNYLKQTIERST